MPFRDKNDLLAEALKKMSTGEDASRSAHSGLAEGMAKFLGQGGDLVALLKNLPVNGAQFLETKGVIPKGSAESLAYAIEQTGAGTPAQQLVNAGLKTGTKTIATQLGAAPSQAQAVANMTPGIGIVNLPTSRDIGEAHNVASVQHTPQTRAGKYAKTIAEFVPAAAFPGSVPTRIANVVVPGAASEFAGQATEGTPLEPYARLAGALAGGVGVAMATRPGPATRMLAEGSQGATDDQIRMAQALREQAQERGVNLTQAEALQQVTDNGTGLGRLQRVMEGTKAGSERTGPYMAARPGEVRQAVINAADAISPPTAQPSVIGLRAQEGATEALRGVERARTNAVNPLYRAADPQHIDNVGVDDILSSLDAEIAADRTGLIGGRLAKLRDALVEIPAGEQTPRIPLTDIGNLDRVRKYFRDQLGLPQIGAEAITKEQAGRTTHYLDQLDQLLETNPDFLAGKQQFGQITRDVIDPLTAGPLGKVAASESVKAQNAALFPSQPLEGAANETSQAMQLLMQQNPTVPPALLRQHLVNSMNEATQNLQSGPNQWGGAKFAATIAGNPEQRQVLMAGVQGAGGDANDMESLLQVLEATGKRQAPGSQTAYNMEDLRRLGEAGTVGETAKAIASGPSMFRRFGDALQSWQVERNAGQLADALLANPEQATEILLEARRRLPPGAGLTEIERLAATVGQARQQGMLPHVP